MRLRVPEQHVELRPSGRDRMMGTIRIDGVDYRIEAYAPESTSNLVSTTIDELHMLADCGGPLHQHVMPDGSKAYLCVMPKGGTCDEPA